MSHLFVYGTLRADAKSAAHHRWMRGARLVGAATVSGRLHDAGRYPAAIPSDAADRIEGELYAIDPDRTDLVLAALDEYEGYDAEAPATSLFVRAVTEATTPDGRTADAWIYWFAGPVAHLPRIRSGDWLASE